MKNSNSDTICAISTPIGSGGISIIRVSGTDSVNILKKIFKTKTKTFKSHKIYYGHIYDMDRLIDEVLVSIMLGKKTFTCEDIVEINCHGGLKVTSLILDLVLKNGARLAEAGEFTKRAFLNGRIDLTSAEAVKDVINAVTDTSLDIASSNLKGKLKEKIVSMRDYIILEIANIEASIDYPEHDMEETNFINIKNSCVSISKDINNMINTFHRGKILKEGLNTAIIGRANVGKSSLLNLLVGEDKAIVTDIAGTTRDVISEYININDIPLKIIDTAGIRETEDVVEKIGVERSIKAFQEADLVLYVVDGTIDITKEDFDIMESIKDKKVITILNKSDLGIKVKKEDILKVIDTNIIEISAKEDKGLDTLYNLIKDMFYIGDISKDSNNILITNIRHKNLLSQAKNSIDNCITAIDLGFTEDLVVIDLTDSYNYLGEIIGENLGEDIIDKIFSEFCLGK
ncbi:MAG: tRNA uridine-5-carboxymethylaminomethyl(34) synthesis GTPase MnmE [Lachnospirales bacterium]